MSPYCKIPEPQGKTLEHHEISRDARKWQRWDGELVEMFDRWLARLARAFAIMILAVSALISIVWFWKSF